jgi:hypothetical protein
MPEQNVDPVEQKEGKITEPYEAPAIESVVSPKELEREVHYAGFSSTVRG